jgi:lipopolysaccharide cholinephosphotransferase
MNLEKEIICGYEVSAKMKRVWAMELGMVKRFVSVCEQYGLTYFIMGGSLLGAVRHEGFIPWDNDIDLAMPRKDFNKLLEVGPGAFEKPLFFQTPVTEQGRFFCTYVKIRDERGTAASENEYRQGINCGMFIDVFCLDEIPDGGLRRKLYYRKLNEIVKMQRFCLGKSLSGGAVNSVKHGLQKMIYKYVYHSPSASLLFDIYQRAAGRYAGRGTQKVEHLAFGHHDNFVWQRSDWADSILLDFEELKLSAPVGYEAILKQQYGNYMQIPEDKSTHDYFEFDPDVSYECFFNR